MNDGGRRARAGFRYQDNVLLEQVLDHLLARQAAAARTEAPPPAPRLGVEAATSTGGPAWDMVAVTSGSPGAAESVRVFSEVKSGAVERRDRITFWRRIRATLVHQGLNADAPGPSRASPAGHFRLVLNASAATLGETTRVAFHGLAKAVGAVAAPSVPPSCRELTAEFLAAEALYFLTNHPAGETDWGRFDPPADENTARRVLENLNVEEQTAHEDLETRVRGKIEQLTFDAGFSGVLLDALSGEVARRATSETAGERWFTPADLSTTVALIRPLASLPRGATDAWKRIREDGARNGGAGCDAAGGLAPVDWRAVQPAAAALCHDQGGAHVLLGAGGIGKSFILRALRTEATADRSHPWKAYALSATLLAAVDASLLGPALTVATVGARGNAGLLLLVDALDNIGDAGRRASVRDALAVAARGSDPPVTVVCSSRLPEWREIAPRDPSGAWTELALEPWPEARVRQHVVAGSEDAALVSLLRTPLFLDLHVRMAGDLAAAEKDPTRYALLAKYWRLRVLRRDDPASVARARAIRALVDAECEGQMRVVGCERWEEAALDLVSEGLLVTRDGDFAFRHALLRDHAITREVLRADASPGTDGVDWLARIQDGLVRQAVLRSVLEASAACDGAATEAAGEQTPGFAELIARVAKEPRLAAWLGAALGAIDDVRGVSLGEILDRVTAEATADVAAKLLAETLAHARHANNAAWLVPLARLPGDVVWAEDVRWLAAEGVLEIADYAKAVAKESAADKAAAETIAGHLRSWTRASRWRSEGRWGFYRSTLDCAVALTPGNETLRWIEAFQLDLCAPNTTVLHALPDLVGGARQRGECLDPERLETVYLRAAGLRWHDGAIRSVACLDDHVHPARLAWASSPEVLCKLAVEAPTVFVRLALVRLVGADREQAAADAAEMDELLDRLVSIHASPGCPADTTPDREPEPTEDGASCGQSAAVATAGRPLRQPWAGCGDLVNDFGGPFERPRGTEAASITKWIAQQLRTVDDCGRVFVQDHLWPAVAASRSGYARILVLQAYRNGPRAALAPMVDALLRDSRVYHLAHAAECELRVAIRERWPELAAGERAVVIAHIRDVQFATEPDGASRVSSLLAAIPEDERPDDLVEFVARRTRGGRPTAPAASAGFPGASVTPFCPAPTELWHTYGGLPGASAAVVAAWRDVFAHGHPFERSGWNAADATDAPDATAGRIQSQLAWLRGVREAYRVALCNPPPVAAVTSHPWPLEFSQSFLMCECEVRQEAAAHNVTLSPQDALDPATLEVAFAWAAECAAGLDVGAFRTDETTPETMTERAWVAATRLMAQLVAHPALSGAAARAECLTAEVRRASDSAVTPVLARLLHEYDIWTASSAGRGVLVELMRGHLRDRRVLVHCVCALPALDAADASDIVRRWVDDLPADDTDDDPDGFTARLAGWLIGAYFAKNNALRTGVERIIDRVLDSQPSDGLLATPTAYRRFLVSLAHRGAAVVVELGLPPGMAPRFGRVVAGCVDRLVDQDHDTWCAHRTLGCGMVGHAAFSLLGRVRPPADGARVRVYWQAVEPVACSLARTACKHVLCVLLQDVVALDTAIKPDALRKLAGATAERLQAGFDDLWEKTLAESPAGWTAVTKSVTLFERVATDGGCPAYLRERIIEALQHISSDYRPAADHARTASEAIRRANEGRRTLA